MDYTGTGSCYCYNNLVSNKDHTLREEKVISPDIGLSEILKVIRKFPLLILYAVNLKSSTWFVVT